MLLLGLPKYGCSTMSKDVSTLSPRVPLLGGCSGNCTIETQRVVGLAWRGGIVVGSLWCGGIVVPKSRRTTNPTTPTTSQRKAHHTGTAHEKSHDKSHDNPTTLRQSFGCLRDHGGPKVRTFCGPLTSCRSTIYTDPPTLVATPTLNPTNSHHLDAPAASGQAPPPLIHQRIARPLMLPSGPIKVCYLPQIPYQFAAKWLCHFASVEK
jgi:hypothetical protein